MYSDICKSTRDYALIRPKNLNHKPSGTKRSRAMKSKFLIFLLTASLLLLCGCGTDPVVSSQSPPVSSETSSVVTSVAPVESELIERYDPDKGEEHYITDEGEQVAANNAYLSAIDDFVLSSGFLYNYMYADRDGTTVTASALTDVDLAFAIIFLTPENTSSVTKDEANKLIGNHFGFNMGKRTLSVPGLIEYDGETAEYTLIRPMLSGVWGAQFTELYSLGNGYMRAYGTSDYSDDANDELFLYEIEVLLVRAGEGKYGFKLKAFTLRSAE